MLAEQVTERIDELFQQFLRAFKDENGKDKYRLRLSQLGNVGGTALLIDFDDLIAQTPNIARQLLDNPNAILHDLELAAWGQLKIEDPEYAEVIKVLKLHFRKLPSHDFIRKLGAAQIGHLTAVDGIIVRSTEVHPLLTKGKFQCRKCNAPVDVEQNFNRPFMRGPGVCAHCFTGDTIISGDYKPISDYSTDDKVVSAHGGYGYTVVPMARDYDGELYQIRAAGILPIQVTPEHPFLVISRHTQRLSINRRRTARHIFSKPIWKKARDLNFCCSDKNKPGDYLLIPRINGYHTQTEVNLSKYTTAHGRKVTLGKGYPLTFPINRETAWLLGLYAAEGFHSHRVGFSLGKHESTLHNKIKSITQQMGYSSNASIKRTTLEVYIQSHILARSFPDWLGSNAKTKRVPTFILYNADKEICRAFLEGYWAGDGDTHKSKQHGNYKRATTVSKVLALQLQLLAARLGIPIQISHCKARGLRLIENRLVYESDTYVVSYPIELTNYRKRLQVQERYILCPIMKINVSNYHGRVHNLETTHETYLANNIAVHNCRSKVFEFVERESEYINSQQLRIQERPEDLPAGQLPNTINVRVIEDLVNTARPGDRVTVTAIVKAQQNYVGRKVALTTFQLELEANYVEVVGKEVDVVELTPEDEHKIIELSKDPFIHRKLIASLAPSIYGYGDIKEAILYLLFGGVAKQLPDGMKIRGEINTLIVGDPGTAKSQLLQYVARAAPRGLYTSGRGTSAAGLTAAVLREKTGGMILEAGALVLADKGLLAVDEFDKMRPEDRVAMHEALEQHSYHPQTEIFLASGKKVKIGEFVDKLFQEHSSEIVLGRNCEILSLNNHEAPLITTRDFQNLSVVQARRVSRHIAPKVFIEVSYSNGRSIIVTPEHPVFIFKGGEIRTVPVSELQENDFVPGPRKLESLAPIDELVASSVSHGNEKTISLPLNLSEDLGKILGYLITEGHSYKGKSYRCSGPSTEVGFSNTDTRLLHEMDSAMNKVFNIGYSSNKITHRYLSSRLYAYLLQNFSGFINKARQKRVPPQIMSAPIAIVTAFLRSAFKGDGSVETNAVAYCTSSKGLVEDYQDLLLRIGVFSRISFSKTQNSYKAYVTGDSLRRFMRFVVDRNDKRYMKIKSLASNSKPQRGHDIMPTEICARLVRLQHQLGMRDDGYFYKHLKRRDGLTIHVFNHRIRLMEKRLAYLMRRIPKTKNIRQLRQCLNWSQEKTALALNLQRSVIDYAERGGYAASERVNIFGSLKESALGTASEVRNEIEMLKDLCVLRWLKVTSIRKTPNEGALRTQWAYDVTIEPTHNFISHGVMLHNTVSVAKAGIVATLNARTAVLAAANPAFGRYDPYKNLIDNISLPVTLLSRMDLIFVMKDMPNVEADEKIAQHILTLHRLKAPPQEVPIDAAMLRKYVGYAKKIEPVLTAESAEVIRAYYMKMRSSAGNDSPIAITARQLEALVRLCEARARAALRTEVSLEDANAIIRLTTISMQEVGVDVTTGKMDIDVIMSGTPQSMRDKIDLVIKTMRDLQKQFGQSMDTALVTTAIASKQLLTEEEVHHTIQTLIKNGKIYEPAPGKISLIG